MDGDCVLDRSATDAKEFTVTVGFTRRSMPFTSSGLWLLLSSVISDFSFSATREAASVSGTIKRKCEEALRVPMGSSGGGIIFPLRTRSSSFRSRALLSGFWVSGGGSRDDDCHIITGWISVSPTGNINNKHFNIKT
jgi:hypothetical protein